MPITELLERNAREFPKDIALVEINPDIQEKRRLTELLIFLLAEVLEKEIKLQFL